MNPIEALLHRRIGLDAASVGSTLIERTIRLRMKAQRLGTAEEYAALLATSLTEWDELIEAVVVAESWFFRDAAAFAALAQLTRPWRQAEDGRWRIEDGTTNPNPTSRYPPSSIRHPRSAPRPGILRVLCLPCASGEEAYSLAMTLLDAGVPPARFTIDAVDISARALARARTAVYGKNSFRGKDLAFRDRHFTATAGGHVLRREVRQCVQFHRGNLLAPWGSSGSVGTDGHGQDYPTGRGEEAEIQKAESRKISAVPISAFSFSRPYDFIFCRNLLIYFDRATQALALQKLHRLLSPDGVLFVGPAELPMVAGHDFVNANLPMAFACRKATWPGSKFKVQSRKSNAQGPTPKVQRPKSASPRGVNVTTTLGGNATATPRGELLPAHCPAPAPPPDLVTARPVEYGSFNVSGELAPWGNPARPAQDTRPQHYPTGRADLLHRARQLADAGKLAAAAAVCERHLETTGPSATAYYLLGVIAEARGAEMPNPEKLKPEKLKSDFSISEFQQVSVSALDYYRRAIYLEPDHYETLVHLALLLERTGDVAGARTFRRRAERSQGRMKNEE